MTRFVEGQTRSSQRDSFKEDALAASRYLAAGLISGVVCGAAIGGLGGRMAMFLLRLTSDPQVLSFETDDGFGIGSFTGDTVSLVGFTAIVGAFGGAVYVVVRRWLPAQLRAVSWAVMAAAMGGALFIEPGGVDFTRLSPHWLAVGLFVALPGLYGYALSHMTERLLGVDSFLQRVPWWGLVPLVVLLVAGPIGVLFVVILGGWGFSRRNPTFGRWLRSKTVTYAGRIVLVGATVLAAVQLIGDAIEILG